MGLSKREQERIEPMLHRAGGLILVAGPTGSGKTSTLYAMLGRVPTASRNIITVEDPVEANLAYASQIQIDRERGLTFEVALSSILRQDPDVILLGEIRDRESAAIAVESAMTGHLVLSSVHMEHAAGVIQRLINMGVEPLALASALRLIVAQRLLPKICDGCRQPHPDQAAIVKRFNLSPKSLLYTGAGCKKCYFTGKSGRIAIFETIVIDDALRDLISTSASLSALAKQAVNSGARTFLQDAMEKCQQGLLTPEDLVLLV
jgi:type II secretory ATPase GspE/PulE/Tfp pilus assembly ATPase PilB-like protein